MAPLNVERTNLCHPSADHELGRIDEAAFLTGKKNDGLCLLYRLAKSTTWELHFTSVTLRLVRAKEILQHQGTTHY